MTSNGLKLHLLLPWCCFYIFSLRMINLFLCSDLQAEKNQHNNYKLCLFSSKSL